MRRGRRSGRGSKSGYRRGRIDASRADDGTVIFSVAVPKWIDVLGSAARLPEGDRKDLAVQVLARSEPVSDLAIRLGLSRKFVYQQTHKVRVALDEAFRSATPDDEGAVRVGGHQGMAAIGDRRAGGECRGSCRGVMEFMRDLWGVSISVSTVHQVLQSAARKADIINQEQDLSAIRCLHDDLFRGAMPVLAGVDAKSTYCYLLAAADHRDADPGACI
jgi:hypothetical protein